MALLEYVRDEEIITRGDSDLSLFCAMIGHNPELLERRLSYAEWLRREGSVDPAVKELAHLATDSENDCAYCTESHSRTLRSEYGVPEERIEALRRGELDSFDDRERAVLRFARQTARDPKRVTEAHVDALLEHGFTDGEVVELLAVVASAVSANTMMDALNVHPADRELEFGTGAD